MDYNSRNAFKNECRKLENSEVMRQGDDITCSTPRGRATYMPEERRVVLRTGEQGNPDMKTELTNIDNIRSKDFNTRLSMETEEDDSVELLALEAEGQGGV